MTSGDIVLHLERMGVRLGANHRALAMEISRILAGTLGVEKVHTRTFRGYRGIKSRESAL